MGSQSRFDVVIVGGGTSGAALAGLLVSEHRLNVCLIEAGPDYGVFESERWPAELLNASRIPADSHSWAYSGMTHSTQASPRDFDRARVIGGCSAHNGCIALLGHYRDYDNWVNIGNPGWAFGSVRPSFLRAVERLRVRQPDDEELTPFQEIFVGGAVASGIPKVDDLNNSAETRGVAAAPVNISDGVRWSSALAYLTEDVRESGRLTVFDRSLVDRLETEQGRITGVVIVRNGEVETVTADRVVLSAGAYGSPGILERSGVGDPDVLRALRIKVNVDLPGVGAALTDHPAVALDFAGSRELDQSMSELAASGWCPDEQALAKTLSPGCDDAFDLHLYSTSGLNPESGEWEYSVYVANVAPRSRGSVHIASRDPEAPPTIDHGFLSDPDDRDIVALIDGVRLTRKIMQPAIDSGMLESDASAQLSFEDDSKARQFVEQNVGIYYHPASSCRMGPSTDPDAVVDSFGKVYGLENLWVCDASIFPVLMRANTNLPAVMVAEHLSPVIAAGR